MSVKRLIVESLLPPDVVNTDVRIILGVMTS